MTERRDDVNLIFPPPPPPPVQRVQCGVIFSLSDRAYHHSLIALLEDQAMMLWKTLKNFEWTLDNVVSMPEKTWPHRWDEVDDRRRSPLLFTFDVMMVYNNDDDNAAINKKYGFYMFSIPMWVEMLSIVILECISAAPTAVLIYYCIIQPQQQKHVDERPRRVSGTTVMGYLVGWCIVLPFWILAPQVVANYLSITNLIVRFCVCVITPTVSIFSDNRSHVRFCTRPCRFISW